MATTVFDDDFTGSAGSIDGRVTSGHTWADADGAGPVSLDGSGAAMPAGAGNSVAAVQMPEIAGPIDFEIEFVVSVLPSTITENILLAVSDGNDPGNSPINLRVDQSSFQVEGSFITPDGGIYPSESPTAGDKFTVRVMQSTNAIELLLNDSVVGTAGLSGIAETGMVDDPYIRLAFAEFSGAVMKSSQVTVRTDGLPPPPTEFWTALQRAREVI